MRLRRILRVVFFILAALFAAAWGYGYLYISGMACAFRGPGNQSCAIPAPWELHGDDFQLMVLIPLSVLLALLLAGWIVGRKSRR